jgi:ribulose-phosphate 3-epimerase
MPKVTICPTITAYNLIEYKRQMNHISPFADRVHIDLMDGEFTEYPSVKLDQIWWPHKLAADIHLMYKRPMDYLEQLIKIKPRMVIIHNEAEVHHMHFAAELHKADILSGLAILQDTPIEYAYQVMHSFDHVLIFSGRLGYHGGVADLGLLDKVNKVRDHHPDAEIGWDGGVNDQNARQLADGGVDVLNVGGYIQKSLKPRQAYAKLKEIIEE